MHAISLLDGNLPGIPFTIFQTHCYQVYKQS